MFSVLLLLCFLAPVTECLAQTANDDRASQDIHGYSKSFPPLVQVQVKEKYRCMAGMVSMGAALVLKSCVKDNELYTIVGGDGDRLSTECWVESRHVSKIIEHSTLNLAILKFKPFPHTPYDLVEPLELAPAGAKFNLSDSSESCAIASWGKKDKFAPTELERMSQIGFLQPVPMSHCTKEFGNDTDSSGYCLTGRPCHGDEGATLRCRVNGVNMSAFGLISKVSKDCELFGLAYATPITNKDTREWIVNNS